MAEDRSREVEDAGAIAQGLLHAVERGELTAPPRLIRLLEAVVRAAEDGDESIDSEEG